MIGNKNLNYITLFELIVDMRRYFIYLLTIVCFCSLHAQNYECSTIQTHRIEVTKSLDKHPDSLALEILSPYSQGVDSLIGGVIGYSDMLMTADRPESLLSNFVADAYVTEAKKMGYNVDFAICNVGGLRSDMPEGAVTKGNILNIAPFQNYFTIVELKGEYVLELFAQIAQSLGEGVSKEVGLVIDGNGTLISSSLKGKAIKPNKTYKIATINYLAEGNDRMEAFKKASKCIVKDDLAQDVLIHYITDENQAGRHLTSSLDGRIKVVGGNPSLDDFEKKRKQDVELLVVHTNDTHSCILPLDPNSVNKSIADKGGYIRRSTLINEMREVDPDLLLLDCGDFSQGSAYYSLYKGEVEVQLMNHMKYDASTIGNHEFDYGIDNMVRIFKMANFPILCCNYDFGETALKDIVKPYTIINRKGLKIGLLGVCPALEGLVFEENYKGISYLDPRECANKIAEYLKNEEKCDLVICISHLGWRKTELGGPSASGQVWDQDFIAGTRNIDVVCGGHSHTYFTHPEYVNNLDGKPVICNQMGKNAQYVGTLTIEMKSK